MTRYHEQVSRLIALLQSIRERPAMYFGEVAVEPAVHFLAGWRLAAAACLDNAHDAHRAVEAERGWPVTGHHPARHMVESGLSPSDMVDELFVIEIEALRRVAAG